VAGDCSSKHLCTGQSIALAWMNPCHTASNCDDTCARKFANLVVTCACCSCPSGVILLCVVGTTLFCSAVCAASDILTSVSVHYLLYSGRYKHRSRHAPDTVGSDTRRTWILWRHARYPSTDSRRTWILWHHVRYPSTFFIVLLFWFPPALFFFFWGSP
jgi:hypothetical protein